MIVIYNKKTKRVIGVSISDKKINIDFLKKHYDTKSNDFLELDYDDTEIMIEFFKYSVQFKNKKRLLKKDLDVFLHLDFKCKNKLSDGRYLINQNIGEEIDLIIKLVDENGNPVKLNNGILEIDPTKGKINKRFFKLDGETHTFKTTWCRTDDSNTYGKIYVRIPEHPMIDRKNIIFEILGEDDDIISRF